MKHDGQAKCTRCCEIHISTAVPYLKCLFKQSFLLSDKYAVTFTEGYKHGKANLAYQKASCIAAWRTGPVCSIKHPRTGC